MRNLLISDVTWAAAALKGVCLLRFPNYTLIFFFFPQQEGVKTENNDHINLKVAGQDGSVVQFKIKRHTPLSKLMKAYCERQVRS